MPVDIKYKNSIAQLLPLRMVGPGYIVLRHPEQYAAVFRLKGGACPWGDSPDTTVFKTTGFQNALMQLRQGEEVQIFTRRVPLSADQVVKNYSEFVHEDAPQVFKEGYSEFFKVWIKEFVEINHLSDFETYVIFTIKPANAGAQGGVMKLFGIKEDQGGTVPLEEVIRRARAWASMLSASGVTLEELKEPDIYKLIFEELTLGPLPFDSSVFNRGALHSAGPDGAQTVREMLSTVPWDFEIPEYFKVGKRIGRVLPVTEFPDFGNYPLFLSSLLQSPYDFRISLYVKGVDQEKAKLRIEKQMKKDMGTADKGTLKNYESEASFYERQEAMQALARRDTALARFSLYITLLGEDPQELKSASDSVSRFFSKFHRMEGFFEQRDLFRSSLPLCRNVTPHHEHLITTQALQNCLSFFYDPLAQLDGVPMGTTQGNQLVCLNPWGRNLSNWNSGVFGIAGKGKSFGISNLIIRFLAMNPYVMIIDASRSYEFLCKTAGGRYLKLGLKNPDSSINVFEYDLEELEKNNGTVDPEHVANILGFLNVICTDAGEKGLQNLDLSMLEDAIKRTYLNCLKKKNPEEKIPLLKDLQETLVEMGKDKDQPGEFTLISKKYAEILKPFIKDGIYANLTDRRTNVKGENSFIVFDTHDLPDDEKLKALAVFIVSQYCIVKAKLNKSRNRRSWLILDEAWTLAQFPAGIQFLLRVAKTSRHLALASTFATQQITDLLNHPDAKPLLDNASMKILLGLGDEDTQRAAQLMELNPTEVSNLKNLRQVRGQYSQALVISAIQRGVLNITPDDLSTVIATTYPPERDQDRPHYIQKYAKDDSTMEIFKALSKWATDRRNNTVEKPTLISPFKNDDNDGKKA